MLDNCAYPAAISLAILTALSIPGIIIINQRSAIRSLKWRAGSPFQFITLCQRCLQHRGWTVEQRPNSFFQLVAKQDEMKVLISCRPSDFGVEAAYLRDVYTWKIRYSLSAVAAITYDQFKPEQRVEAAKAGVFLIRYNEIDSLAARLRCLH